MSKLIVEMEMPTRCGACKCRHVEFDIDRVAVFCGIKDNEYVEDADSRPSWCPIKGVLPEEHEITLLIEDMREGSEFFNEVRDSHVNDYRVATYYSLRMIDAADAFEQLMAECQQLKEDRRGEER